MNSVALKETLKYKVLNDKILPKALCRLYYEFQNRVLRVEVA